MNEIKKLSNIDLLALIRTVSLELENRECEGKVTKYVAREIPSTVAEGYNPQIPIADEMVEHDGKMLRKVDRKCKAGDFVRFSGLLRVGDTKNGKLYEIVNNALYVNDVGGMPSVYGWVGYCPNPEIFEVVGAVPQIIKSPNQQRAELIQRAREFVEGLKDKYGRFYYSARKLCLDAEFIINDAKSTVVCLLRGTATNNVYSRGIAKCMPGDVFNEWIGKAIALAKALQIDIPQEFMQAVQPNEKVNGMVVEYEDKPVKLVPSEDFLANWRDSGTAHVGSVVGINSVIIDDTNAVYESMGE